MYEKSEITPLISLDVKIILFLFVNKREKYVLLKTNELNCYCYFKLLLTKYDKYFTTYTMK